MDPNHISFYDFMSNVDSYAQIHKNVSEMKFTELPMIIQRELLTWAMCYNREIFKVLPLEIFIEICGWIQTER